MPNKVQIRRLVEIIDLHLRIGKHFGFLKLDRNKSNRIQGLAGLSPSIGYLKQGYLRTSFDSSGGKARSPQGRGSQKYPIGSSLDGALSRSIRKSIDDGMGRSEISRRQDVTVGSFYMPGD